MTEKAPPEARPAFRRLARIVAVFCLLLGLALALFDRETGFVGVGVSLFVGFVMATIATYGTWPRKRP
jgi:hypothetical protein